MLRQRVLKLRPNQRHNMIFRGLCAKTNIWVILPNHMVNQFLNLPSFQDNGHSFANGDFSNVAVFSCTTVGPFENFNP